jgi:PAS domain S-box-containing protein/putative nucleotidyltransferase with HDIG domain
MSKKGHRITGMKLPLELGMPEVLDAFPNYVMLVDQNHHILFANKAVSRDLGVDPKRIVGGYCPKVVHGLDTPFPGCPLEEAVEKGQAVERELSDTATGRWVSSAIYPTGFRTQQGQAIFLHMIHDITEKVRAEEELRRHYDTQRVLNSLLQLSLEDIPLYELLKQAFNPIMSIPWLTVEAKGSISLVEDEPDILVMKVQSGLPEPLQKTCARVAFNWCLCGRAAATQEIQFADCIDNRHDTTYEGISPHGHYCVPIVFRGQTLGVINTYLKEGHPREPSEEEFLTAFANVLANIIAHGRAEIEVRHTSEELREAFMGTVEAMATMVEMRDPYTAGHQQRVANLATAIAAEMGLSEALIQQIHIAGLIHDVGKMYVPADILNKPGRLTELEFAMIKTHSQVGYDILKNIQFPWPIAQIVLQHHERMDGSGYPAGLSGKDIMLEAKILAVADVVEAMASHRPYRPAIGLGMALEEISQKAGVLYDADVVDACTRLFYDKGFKFE